MFKKLGVIVSLIAVGFMLSGALHKTDAAVDSWSGHTEVIVPFSQSVVSGTPAVLFTAVSTVRPNIRSVTITDSASGVVEILDGSGSSSVIAAFGLIANTPLVLSEDNLGVGIRATLGNGLYINGATGTVSITARIRKDAN